MYVKEIEGLCYVGVGECVKCGNGNGNEQVMGEGKGRWREKGVT